MAKEGTGVEIVHHTHFESKGPYLHHLPWSTDPNIQVGLPKVHLLHLQAQFPSGNFWVYLSHLFITTLSYKIWWIWTEYLELVRP